MAKARGATPICPECGSAETHATDTGRSCGRCGHAGRDRQFLAHLVPGRSADRHVPFVAAEDEEARRQSAPFDVLAVDDFMSRHR